MRNPDRVQRYQQIARARVDGAPMRIALAGFIGLAAWFLAPSVWPIVWFTLVCAGQAVDRVVFSALLTPDSMPPRQGLRLLGGLSVGFNCLVYSAIAVPLWLDAGAPGQVFAMVQIAGGLLHVSLTLAGVRGWLAWAVGGHGVYFIGLPAAEVFVSGRPEAALIVGGACLYMAHLALAVRQTRSQARALEEAEYRARAAADAAQSASAFKTEFLSALSHEIRTPMNAVMASGELLACTRLDPRQREHVDLLRQSGRFLVTLLDSVLDLSKIEAGKMQIKPVPASLSALLSHLERLWQAKAQERGIDLEVIRAPGLPDTVMLDEVRFQQIVSNLLSNAIKFTSQGRVSLTVDWDTALGGLTVTVADTGCGIAPDRIDAVFEAFEQADGTTAKRFGGSGLGLAISRKLARLMGGDLVAESRIGEGSRFLLRCPAEPVSEAAARDEPHALPLSDLTGLQILIADDHAVNRRILQLYLEPLSCQLTLVENGEEAVDAVLQHPFDLILMDMQMPVLDGLEASRRIRASEAGQRIPILAVTASALDEHRQAWREVGAAGFITKPICPQALFEALQAALSQSRQPAVPA